jgi:predicted peptidase
MRLQKTTLVYFICLIFIYGCSNGGSEESANVPRTYQDVEKDFDAINFKTGINDISLANFRGGKWDFRVIMPNVNLTNNLRPLIITLHGAAGGSPDAHKQTACYVETAYAGLNAIIISPNGYVNLWSEAVNQEQVLALVDLATKYLPVDKNKIVIEGYSNGGNGAWFFAETQPQIFSAAIPSASYYNTTNNSIGRLIKIPVYAIHGEKDALFPVADVQRWVDATNASGSKVTLVIAPGLTHPEPCSYVNYMKGAAEWLVNDVWK